jgi:hypothetical protein
MAVGSGKGNEIRRKTTFVLPLRVSQGHSHHSTHSLEPYRRSQHQHRSKPPRSCHFERTIQTQMSTTSRMRRIPETVVQVTP